MEGIPKFLSKSARFFLELSLYLSTRKPKASLSPFKHRMHENEKMLQGKIFFVVVLIIFLVFKRLVSERNYNFL